MRVNRLKSNIAGQILQAQLEEERRQQQDMEARMMEQQQ
jgi:hypothetical protein